MNWSRNLLGTKFVDRLKVFKIVVLLFTLLGLNFACSTISYYSQSVGGHLSVWMKRRDMQSLINSASTKPKLKKRLRLVLKIRKFASQELGLPDNYSFKSYVNLKRKHVVWNVLAAPEFSVEPIKFCFPIVGCLSYKGYFAKKRAEKEALRLSYQGLDVTTGGVTAYSTLGWFSDPVLSTFVNWKEADLAGLIFHELAHQLIYLSGDTTFNESFASMIEIEGVKRWMKKQGTPKLSRKYFLAKKRDDEFMRLVLKTRDRLKILYKKKITIKQMRLDKQAVFKRMRKDYVEFKKRWMQYKGYDRFINTDLNNAKIAGASTYFEFIKSFQNLLKQQHNDLKKFYAEIFKFGKLSTDQRKLRLNKLKL